MPDEKRRVEMSLHFVLLGGLRYNKRDLLELLKGVPMMPIERLRESSFYQLILEEGREEGVEIGREKERKAALLREADTLRLLADKRFPGIQLGPEVEAVGDPDKLHRLCHELDEIPDPEMLRRRLIEMATASPSSD